MNNRLASAKSSKEEVNESSNQREENDSSSVNCCQQSSKCIQQIPPPSFRQHTGVELSANDAALSLLPAAEVTNRKLTNKHDISPADKWTKVKTNPCQRLTRSKSLPNQTTLVEDAHDESFFSLPVVRNKRPVSCLMMSSDTKLSQSLDSFYSSSSRVLCSPTRNGAFFDADLDRLYNDIIQSANGKLSAPPSPALISIPEENPDAIVEDSDVTESLPSKELFSFKVPTASRRQSLSKKSELETVLECGSDGEESGEAIRSVVGSGEGHRVDSQIAETCGYHDLHTFIGTAFDVCRPSKMCFLCMFI